MRNNKGITLIEIVVSIFLIGLIAATFLTAFNNSLFAMGKGNEMVKELHKAQQTVEVAIEKVKNKETVDDVTKIESNSHRLFGKDINGKFITQSAFGANELFVFVPDELDLEERLPLIEPDSVKIKPTLPIYGAKSGQDLTGESMVSDTNREYYFMSLKRWNISDKGFDGSVPKVTNENEGLFGERYPMFPFDYEKNDSEYTVLNNLGRFIGSHIIYSVIPVSRLSIFGKEEASQPIYIMGPPKLDNIKFHFDPFTLRDDSGNFYEDNVPIQKWRDYSRGSTPTAATNFTFTYEDNNNKIALDWIDGDGKAAMIENSKATVDLGSSSSNQVNKSNLTFFIVYKNSSDSLSNQSILKSYANDNSFCEVRHTDNNFEFNIKQSGTESVSIREGLEDVNKKVIITAVTTTPSSGNSKLFMALDIGDGVEATASFKFSGNMNKIIIGDTSSNENIYEIIIYNSALSEGDRSIVREYLAEKHRIHLDE